MRHTALTGLQGLGHGQYSWTDVQKQQGLMLTSLKLTKNAIKSDRGRLVLPVNKKKYCCSL